MTSGEKDRDGPPPADDEGRSLLFGWQKVAGTSEQGPGEALQQPGRTATPEAATAPSSAKDAADSADPPDLAGPLASLEATQQRILARLAELISTLAADGKGERDLVEAAGTLAEATEWSNNIKAAMAAHLATVGQLIEGLKGGRRDFDTVVAELKSREAGISGQLETFGERMRELDTLLKRLDRRSSELEALKQELAEYYGRWTAAFETMLQELNRLSKRLDAGDNLVTRLEGQIGPWTDAVTGTMERNAAAQRAAAEQTSGNVEKLSEAGITFLERFDAGSRDALEGYRREWKRTRRWTVPALALALVLSAPSFAVVGAVGQSEVGAFDPYDDTQGWKQGVWERYGKQVQGYMLKSLRTKDDVRCSFDVVYP